MRKLVGLSALLFVIIYAGSCKKETAVNASSQSLYNGSLKGTWELRQMVGSVPAVNYPAGNGSIITFTDDAYRLSDSSSILFYIGHLSKEGHYYSMADTSVEESVGWVIPSGQFANRLILNNDTTAQKIFFQVTDDQLIMMSGFFPNDGGIEKTYERLKDDD